MMKKNNTKISVSILKQLYCKMLKIRKFEEKIIDLYPAQEMRCPVHLYIGQEAIASGVCASLNKEDYIVSNHRNHGHLIAKGADLRPMVAELYGKSDGCSGGKGGSMHMVASGVSAIGTSAIVAGGLPIAVGCAFSSKIKKEKRVTAVFFGDGAVDEGTFYESLNFASLFKLPVIFVCENNFYATNSHQKNRQSNPNIRKIADFFRMPSALIDGNDVIKVWGAAKKFVEKARSGKGPCFIEARTYRYCTHVGPETDVSKGLRERSEYDFWVNRCPLKLFTEHLLKKKLMKYGTMKALEKEIDREIQEALDFAVKSKYPQKEDLYKDVY